MTLPAGAGPREPAPPPNREPTAALLIEGFMRPFTLPQVCFRSKCCPCILQLNFGPLKVNVLMLLRHSSQVKELLGQTGTVKSLWMPTIKNLAYVVYESAEEAEATRYSTGGRLTA